MSESGEGEQGTTAGGMLLEREPTVRMALTINGVDYRLSPGRLPGTMSIRRPATEQDPPGQSQWVVYTLKFDRDKKRIVCTCPDAVNRPVVCKHASAVRRVLTAFHTACQPPTAASV